MQPNAGDVARHPSAGKIGRSRLLDELLEIERAGYAVLDDRDRCEDVIQRLAELAGVELPERWAGGFREWLELVEHALEL